MNERRSHDAYASLRIPSFRWYVLSHGAMTVATQIQAIVVGWQLYGFTGDPLTLGLVGLAEALPFLSLSLYAGHVADRLNRRRIALASILTLLVCSALLLLFTMREGMIGPHRVWPVYGVIFLSGIARAFLRPASTALSAEIVPRELFPNAVAWRSSIWQFAAVAGPAAGGLLYGFSGPRLAYSVDTVLMVLSLSSMARVAYVAIASQAPLVGMAKSLTIGIRFVLDQPVLLGAMSLDLFSVLFGGAVALLPVFAADILHVGPQGLGLLRAAPAAGSVVMGLILAHRPPTRHAGRTLLISVTVFGLSIVGFGLSRVFWLSVLLLVASGMSDNVSVVIRSTLLQVMTPRDLFGRVSSVNQIFIGSSNEIGAFESGVTAKLMGTVPAVLFGGCMTLLVVAITAWKVPQLRKVREIQ